MWVGVSRGGYSFLKELPIFLLIFLLPAVLAVLARTKFYAGEGLDNKWDSPA
jgi:hypothetical protein